MVFPACPFGQPADCDRLWYCRDIYRVAAACLYQRRYHSCFFRWIGVGVLSRDESDLDGNVVSVLSAFGVEWASKTQNVREDSAIAGIWSLGMALGVIFIS